MCGYSRHDTVRSALVHICDVTLACRSSKTPIGTDGPTIARAAATTAPSQSSMPSDICAPWRHRNTMSTGTASRSPPRMCSLSSRQALAVAGELGSALKNDPATTSIPCASARRHASPYPKPSHSNGLSDDQSHRSNDRNDVGIGEKELDLCCTPEM